VLTTSGDATLNAGSWLRASTGSARVAKKRGGEHSRRQRSAKAYSIARCARVLYSVPVSGYLTIRNIRRLFYGIWIYLDHAHQLSVSTRCQNGHYPVNPDGAGASRIHSLRSTRPGAPLPPSLITHGFVFILFFIDNVIACLIACLCLPRPFRAGPQALRCPTKCI
jgi:hypothetical protein